MQDQRHPSVARGVRRGVYVFVGCLFVALAVLGAALPVLPTTPFLLIASACFVRSSPALNQRLLRSRLFGPLLRDWQQNRGVRLHVKVTAVTVLLGTVAASIVFGELSLPLLILLIALALVGLVVVLRLPVVRDQPQGSTLSQASTPTRALCTTGCANTRPFSSFEASSKSATARTKTPPTMKLPSRDSLPDHKSSDEMLLDDKLSK